jgi:hypothetical protein
MARKKRNLSAAAPTLTKPLTQNKIGLIVKDIPILKSVETVPLTKLYLFRVRVSIIGDIVDYYVEAPTQCSAQRHTALREEVVDILHVEAFTLKNYFLKK